MNDHERTWRRITAMARACYLEDPYAAHLDALCQFDGEQRAAYLREYSLYTPYREGMGEAT
jgi:hypothetical protein